MSSQKEKITNDLNICVVHDNLDERIAQSLIDKVSNNYKNGIKNLKINLINTNYSILNNCKNTQLLFMFNSNEENIKKTILFSNKYKLITMSYDSKLLEDGVGISLFLGSFIFPLIISCIGRLIAPNTCLCLNSFGVLTSTIRAPFSTAFLALVKTSSLTLEQPENIPTINKNITINFFKCNPNIYISKIISKYSVYKF